jgi:hypothetical protein
MTCRPRLIQPLDGLGTWMILPDMGCRALTYTVVRDFSRPGSPLYRVSAERDIKSTLVACEGCDIARSLLLLAPAPFHDNLDQVV